MRIRLFILMSALLCTTSLAQTTTPSPPDLVVEKHGWSKERINWERDPFSGTVDSFDDVRRRVGDERRMERARGAGDIGEASKIERERRAEQVLKSRQTAPPRYAFLYKLVVRNTGGKTIKELDWDYVFTDAATGQEVGRRQFTAIEKIAPGKRKDLEFLISSPPAQTISVHALNKKEHEGLVGQVVIVRLVYEDETVWPLP